MGEEICEEHDLEIVDASFDHEFGVERIFYYQCAICGKTHNEDRNIPDQVDQVD